MKIKDPERLIKFVAGTMRAPKFLRQRTIKNDHSGKLTVGPYEIAEFESPEEEDEFFKKLIDGPAGLKDERWWGG